MSAALEHARQGAKALSDAKATRVMDSVPGDVRTMMADILRAPDAMTRLRLASELLASVSDADRTHLARDYFLAELQGFPVTTGIGDVHFIGSSWRELKRGLSGDELKARLFPHIRAILASGDYHGREDLIKSRDDAYVAFHFFSKRIDLGVIQVEAGVTVGERGDANLEIPAYIGYALNHEFNSRWRKRMAGTLVPGQEPGDVPATGAGKPTLDDIMGENDAGINLVILAVYDQDGQRHPGMEDGVEVPDRKSVG